MIKLNIFTQDWFIDTMLIIGIVIIFLMLIILAIAIFNIIKIGIEILIDNRRNKK